MKKILLLLFTVAFITPPLMAQDCECGDVKFSITNWICKGKDSVGNPIYEGKLTIENNAKCKFILTEIMQQTGGDVTVPLPIIVPAGSTYSTSIVYTNVPPHASPGSTPYFIVVYNLDDKKCKFEFPSDKIPDCDKNCACSDDGWLPFVATINGVSQRVECGWQFGLNCKDSIILKGEYLCKENCTAKYSAVLVDAATNTVVVSYPNFSFPWIYYFAGNGSYYLEITPICGDTKCKPCRFYFTVRGCYDPCYCDVPGWQQPLTATIDGVTQTITGGQKLELTCKDSVTLNGKYICRGDCKGDAKYLGWLYDADADTMIGSYFNFTFPLTYQFPGPGNYRLGIAAVCGEGNSATKCQGFEFYFTVKDCPVNCECNPDGWQPLTATIGGTTRPVTCGWQFGLTCKDTVTLKGEYKCIGDCLAKYSAVLVDAVTNTVVASYPTFSFPWIHQFPGPGNYYLEITPICGNKKCQPCRFYFTVRDCPTTCDCSPNGWQRFTAWINNDSLSVSCGFQFSVYLNTQVKLLSKYICLGDCNATYAAVLTNTVTGAVIQTWSPLLWPWDYLFTAEGNYKLEITPICGNKKCNPCVFYFTVRKPVS